LKGGKKKMVEKQKFNVIWHKGGVTCSVCGKKKNISEDRYEKLQKKRMVTSYICRDCRKKQKGE